MLSELEPVARFSRRSCLRAVLLASVSVAALSGCSMFKRSAITQIEIDLIVSAQANPDHRKRPSPVVLRLYELKGRAQFDALDFVTLTERDKETLGADLVSREEIVLRPGETRTITKKVSPDAAFLGVTAGFRNIERAQWRAVTALQGQSETEFQIKVDALTVTIAPKP